MHLLFVYNYVYLLNICSFTILCYNLTYIDISIYDDYLKINSENFVCLL